MPDANRKPHTLVGSFNRKTLNLLLPRQRTLKFTSPFRFYLSSLFSWSLILIYLSYDLASFVLLYRMYSSFHWLFSFGGDLTMWRFFTSHAGIRWTKLVWKACVPLVTLLHIPYSAVPFWCHLQSINFDYTWDYIFNAVSIYIMCFFLNKLYPCRRIKDIFMISLSVRFISPTSATLGKS